MGGERPRPAGARLSAKAGLRGPVTATDSAAPASRRRRRPIGRAWLIGLGILLTFAGLASLSLLLPANPAAPVFLYAAATFLLVWIGGILMGRARGAP